MTVPRYNEIPKTIYLMVLVICNGAVLGAAGGLAAGGGLFGMVIGAQHGVLSGLIIAPITAVALRRKSILHIGCLFLGSGALGIVVAATMWSGQVLEMGMSLLSSALLAIVYGVAGLPDQKPELGRCQRCRYDLTGNVSGICPECGTAIDPQQLARLSGATSVSTNPANGPSATDRPP